MIDGETSELLRRGVVALERLADHFAPIEEPRQKRQAILSTAIYDREERERQKLREALREKEQKQTGRTPETDERGF